MNMEHLDRILEDLSHMQDRLRRVRDGTNPMLTWDRGTQTSVSISHDKYSGNPRENLMKAWESYWPHICHTSVTVADVPNIRHCFPKPEFFDQLGLDFLTLGDLIKKYNVFDGDAFRPYNDVRHIKLSALCNILKKRNIFLNSTLPEVYYSYNANKHYTFDIVRELKFFRCSLNGLDYDITFYYLFLESEGIPISKILAHPHVRAQVGINVNVTHSCPDIVRLLDSPLFQKLMNMAESFTGDVIERIKTRIIAISTVIYNLSRWSMSKLTTADLIVNLASSIAICIPISTMTEFFKRIFTVSAQSGIEDNIRQILKAFFLSLFALIVGKLPGKHTVDEFVNRVHKFPCAFESIQKFWKQIDPITEMASNYIESEILGYDVIQEKTIMEEVQQWASTVEEYSDLYKKRAIMKDKETMLAAGRVHVDGVRLLSKCMRLHYSRENVELVRSLLPTTYKISEIAIRSGADHSKPRREPLIVWFCGRSGVGKSTMGYPFLCDMMKSELGPGEILPENWVQKIYARAPECEFFDGDPTDWIVYDDGFQIRDSVANPSPELFEIIRLGNMFPYMYHKASIEEKGNCFADVKGIVISSNIERIMAESIHCPEAVARRIRYAYKVNLKPEFRVYYIGSDGKETYKLDKSAISGPNMDIYQFHPFDPLSGEETGEILTYKQVVLQCALALQRLGDEYVSYEKWLDHYREVPFTKVVAQIGSLQHRSPFMDCLPIIDKYYDGKFLTNQELMKLHWFVNSQRNIDSLRRCVGEERWKRLEYTIGKLQKLLGPGVFQGSSFNEHDYAAFRRELYENKVLSKTRKVGGDCVQRIIVDDSCEIIRPCRFFNPIGSLQSYFGRVAAKSWARGKREYISELYCAVRQDLQALRANPIRCAAATAYEVVEDFASMPYAFNMMSKYLFNQEILSEDGMFSAYMRREKSKSDARMRFEHADFLFRTHLPYVQTGASVSEVTDEDIVKVENVLQKWKDTCKRMAADAWKLTRQNYPNMLLYTVGFFVSAYSLYRFVYIDCEDEEVEEERPVVQSLDESGSKTQPRVKARVQNTDHSSGPHQRQTSRAKVQSLDQSSGPSHHQTHRAKVQAQIEADLQPEWRVSQNIAKPQAQGNTSSAIDHQLYSVLDSRIYANTLMAYVTKRGEDNVQRRLGHIIALKGSLFLMNYHFVLVLKLYGDSDVVIRQGNNIYHRCSTQELIRNYVQVGKRDLVVFEMKRKGVAFCDLVKHIQSKGMSYSHSVQTVMLARQRLSGMAVSPNPITSVDATLSTSLLSIELDLRGEVTEIVNAESWLYTAVTQDGDCGALLLISNNRVPSKIVGVHNAFDPYRSKAIAVPLYRDEIEQAISVFNTRLQYGWKEDYSLDVRALEFDQGENFNVVRCEIGSIPANSKTRLAKSPIFEKLVPTLTKPGYLRPIKTEDGGVIDPARIARAKWGYHLPAQDEAIGARVTDAVVQVFMRHHRPGHERYLYPLTTEEAIVGIPGVEGLNSINKVSSPGYPYVFQKIPGRGKTGYFGEYEFDLTLPGARQIIHEVQQMELDILNNKRPFVVWIDTLKDARIPIEKANRGKTRIFSAGPMAYTILYRKYFLPPIAHCMHNRIDNHIAVGINPTSPEWHTLSLKLKSKGKHCIAGDYACFDGKAPTEGYLSALEFFKAWYVQNWEHVVSHRCNVIEGYEMQLLEFCDFLDKIFLEVVNHIHLMEHEIDGVKHHLFYSVCNGQPSGNPGTAMVNSAQGLWMALRCWLELTKDTAYCTVSQFFEHVYLIDYGDDVAMNITSEAISFYNQNTLTRCMKKLFDIEFTDEKKTGDEQPDSRELSDITFLKRGFVFNDDIQMYVCPMEVHTLLDILNWVRTGSEDARVITINNIASVAAELALVSEEVFKEWLPRLKQAYSQLSWRVNKEIYFDTYYGYLLSYRNAQFKSVEL